MKISVIIPVYNKSSYIKEMFICLQRQDFKNFECVLVNDGSTDGSDKICDEIVALDTRFKVVHITNGGVSHARNVGLSMVQGEYIAFLDADDKIPDNYLSCLYNRIESTKADIVVCSITKVWTNGRIEKVPFPKEGFCKIEELMGIFARCQKETGIYGYCWGKLLRNSLINGERFDTSFCLAEDFDFLLKIYPICHTILFTDETTYYYLQEAENSSGMVDDYDINYRAQLDINLHYRDFLKKMNAYTGENFQIVSQRLCKYIFFTWFYCKLDSVRNCFKELQQVCKQEKIELIGENIFEKWFFLLLKNGQCGLADFTLKFYRRARKILKRNS